MPKQLTKDERMHADLVSLLEYFKSRDGAYPMCLEYAIEQLNDPVREIGKWEPTKVQIGKEVQCVMNGFKCSCGRIVMQKENYCPECGKKMRGVKNDNKRGRKDPEREST